jgi:hypothetical protein
MLARLCFFAVCLPALKQKFAAAMLGHSHLYI